MFEQIGAVIARAARGRARIPVHRQSWRRGYCESAIWRRTSRQEVRQIVLAARRYEVSHRAPGARNGPLGPVALEILDYLANIVDFRTGRLEPALVTMMRVLRRSRDAIVRALKNLRDHGFLGWLRRCEPTGQSEGRGPRLQQSSNAYRLMLPECARHLLGRFASPPPIPEDHQQRMAERVAVIAAHRSGLSLPERASFDFGDTPLGKALARLGKSLVQCESAERTESGSVDINRGV